MKTESAQLLVMLRTVLQMRALTREHKRMLVDVLRQSSQEIVREAWVALSPTQCERLWEIARSVRY
ncbi:MAG: hypothetical protein IGR76_03735 [Synechococcales cyanobacterium T60_A2020_003]|nr:hypothetical protein [Synechococcales cyanobacterium T60_A2020_003]